MRLSFVMIPTRNYRHAALFGLLSACASEVAPEFDCAAEPARAIARTFYVAPSGNDTATGSQDAPFATLQRAQLAVRSLVPAMGDLIVRVEPGDYILDATLAFDERDSGAGGYKVIYEADAGPGTVRILGGPPITGWVPAGGAVLAASVAPGTVFHTLYEDGIRADEARFPDRSSPFAMARAGYLVTTDGTSTTLTTTDLPLIDDPSALKIVIWSNAGHAWFTDTVPVTAIDRATGQIELAHATRYPIGAGSRFFLEGAHVLLDSPGEWFLDRVSSTLYYWPRSAAPREVIAPTLTTLVSVVGSSPATPVHDLQFRGLGFEATDFTDWYRFGWPAAGDSGESHVVPEFDRQLEMATHRLGMITMENTERVDVVFSSVADAGYGGIYLRFANQHDCIYGNVIEHVGANGITLQGGYPGEGDVSHDNTVANDLVHDIGELVGNAAGIDVSNSGYNDLAYDEIHDSPRYGVLVHGAAHVSGDLLYAQGNTVRDLAITDTCQDSGDTAAVYVFGVSQDGTTKRSNVFHDLTITGTYADPSMTDLAPNGVYTDTDSASQQFMNIAAAGTAGDVFRSNDPLPQDASNVSWLPGFDATQLDREIGLRSDFPAAYRSR